MWGLSGADGPQAHLHGACECVSLVVLHDRDVVSVDHTPATARSTDGRPEGQARAAPARSPAHPPRVGRILAARGVCDLTGSARTQTRGRPHHTPTRRLPCMHNHKQIPTHTAPIRVCLAVDHHLYVKRASSSHGHTDRLQL